MAVFSLCACGVWRVWPRVCGCVRVTAIRILDIFPFPRFRPPLPRTPCDLILKNKKAGRIINKEKKNK